LPILMVMATQAKGTTWIRGIQELRVKETDRVNSMVPQLRKMGAKIGVRNNAIWIKGPAPLKGVRIKSFGDHRTAMSFIVAGMISEGKTSIDNISSINTSFPSFLKILRQGGCRFIVL